MLYPCGKLRDFAFRWPSICFLQDSLETSHLISSIADGSLFPVDLPSLDLELFHANQAALLFFIGYPICFLAQDLEINLPVLTIVRSSSSDDAEDLKFGLGLWNRDFLEAYYSYE